VPRSAEGLEFRLNHWQSKNIELSYIGFGASLQLEFPTANFFRQAFVRGGANISFDQIERQVTNSETCVLPPDESVTTAFAPSFEHVGLRIKAEPLLSKLAALIDATPSRSLMFDQATRANGPAIGNLRRMLMFFAAELESKAPALVVAELEQALIVSFICSNRHNYSALLDDRPRRVASWQVRRAEEYIEAHWDRPITIEELVRVTSTSMRSLFYQFKHSRGQSPMAFVKDIRLQRARDLLERSDPAPSITKVAVACGFGAP
jgi:AraC-like DNA-binding protein